MKPINTLPPFKRFCVTIGNLPSSYVDSMSYYECLMWLCKYLKDTVIPAVNENAEAVNELINWFNNLDVQDEVNNKLDEMAESGELEEIIASYLNTNAVLEFNTIADLKSAINIIDGSVCRTLGQNTYNDNKGSLYKIRTVTSGDTVDEINILSLNISETLIAERILENNKEKCYIFIGDSYGTGDNELGEHTTPWTTLVPQYMGLSEHQYYTDSSNGSGFCHGYTFIEQLKRVEENVKNKNNITDIVIIGGYNDASHSISDILTAMGTFFTYSKTHFSNAQVSIGCVGWSRIYTARQLIANRSLNAYSQCGKFGGRYLKNVEYILHDYSLFSDDNYHPNQNGQNELSTYLVDAIKTGSCNVIRGFVTPTIEISSSLSNFNPSNVLQMQNNGVITLSMEIGYFTSNVDLNLSRNNTIGLLKFTDGLIMGTGISAFNTRAIMFTANSNATNLYDVPVIITPVYDTDNVCCSLNLIVDRTKNTYSGVSAFNIGTIYMELPALYC